ncbi:hypothetical protein ONZ45_g5230 [Pleurotus djamor]|nr:hypothetical protein ONZ45_g5230 [Pleurotus djamor]
MRTRSSSTRSMANDVERDALPPTPKTPKRNRVTPRRSDKKDAGEVKKRAASDGKSASGQDVPLEELVLQYPDPDSIESDGSPSPRRRVAKKASPRTYAEVVSDSEEDKSTPQSVQKQVETSVKTPSKKAVLPKGGKSTGLDSPKTTGKKTGPKNSPKKAGLSSQEKSATSRAKASKAKTPTKVTVDAVVSTSSPPNKGTGKQLTKKPSLVQDTESDMEKEFPLLSQQSKSGTATPSKKQSAKKPSTPAFIESSDIEDVTPKASGSSSTKKKPSTKATSSTTAKPSTPSKLKTPKTPARSSTSASHAASSAESGEDSPTPKRRKTTKPSLDSGVPPLPRKAVMREVAFALPPVEEAIPSKARKTRVPTPSVKKQIPPSKGSPVPPLPKRHPKRPVSPEDDVFTAGSSQPRDKSPRKKTKISSSSPLSPNPIPSSQPYLRDIYRNLPPLLKPLISARISLPTDIIWKYTDLKGKIDNPMAPTALLPEFAHVFKHLQTDYGHLALYEAVTMEGSGVFVNPVTGNPSLVTLDADPKSRIAKIVHRRNFGSGPPVVFLLPGVVKACDLTEKVPVTGGSPYAVKRISVWPFRETWQMVTSYLGAVFGRDLLFAYIYENAVTFSTRLENSSKDDSPQKGKGRVWPSKDKYPPSRSASDAVPIYDARPKPGGYSGFEWRDTDWENLDENVPLYKNSQTQGNIPNDNGEEYYAVQVGFTVSTYVPTKKAEEHPDANPGPKVDFLISFNIMFALVLGKARSNSPLSPEGLDISQLSHHDFAAIRKDLFPHADSPIPRGITIRSVSRYSSGDGDIGDGSEGVEEVVAEAGAEEGDDEADEEVDEALEEGEQVEDEEGEEVEEEDELDSD